MDLPAAGDGVFAPQLRKKGDREMVREKSMVQFREYDENIINTVREPLIVLDQDLRVVQPAVPSMTSSR